MILVGLDGSESSTDALELATHLARAKGEPVVQRSSRSGGLGDVARAAPADTIVVGSPVADELLRIAPCPVAVAPRGYARRYANRLEHVVAAFDGPPEAEGPVDVLVTDLHGYGLLTRQADCPVLVVPGRR